MDIKNFYDLIKGDYESILSNIGDPSIVAMFAKKISEDPSYSELESALNEGRVEDAFRASHTLKGVCLNLGFTKLAESAAALTDNLRDGTLKAETSVLFEAVKNDWTFLTDNIKELD